MAIVGWYLSVSIKTFPAGIITLPVAIDVIEYQTRNAIVVGEICVVLIGPNMNAFAAMHWWWFYTTFSNHCMRFVLLYPFVTGLDILWSVLAVQRPLLGKASLCLHSTNTVSRTSFSGRYTNSSARVIGNWWFCQRALVCSDWSSIDSIAL